MAQFGTDPAMGAGSTRRGPTIVAVVVLLVALSTTYLPDTAQSRIAFGIRWSLLRPFLAFQNQMTETQIAAQDVEELRAQLDSLSEATMTHAALADENRTLASLLELSDRLGDDYMPAVVLRPGTPGSESMFILYVGSDAGVHEGSPVVNRHGLVGLIREVRAETSVGMDWTHPDFRASAMTEDGSSYGVVENRRGAFREQDRLVLAGGAYHEDVADSTLVVTSGLGGVFPRGLPIGRIDGVAETEGQWSKTYWLRPFVQPPEVTHVLVAFSPDSTFDMALAFPPDSAASRQEILRREREDGIRLRALADTVRRMRVELGLPVSIPDSLRAIADSLGIPADSARLLADSLGVPVQAITGPALGGVFRNAIRSGARPIVTPPVRRPAAPTPRPSTTPPDTAPTRPPPDTVPNDTIAVAPAGAFR